MNCGHPLKTIGAIRGAARGLPLATLVLLGGSLAAAAGPRCDLVVYGATSGGIVAAIQARTMGKSVILVEPGRHLGGLTAGGLGATDIGNKAAIGGLSREFYRRIGRHYARPEAWKHEERTAYRGRRQAADEPEMWTFEPHVAALVYRDWLAEAGVTVVFDARLDLGPGGVEKEGRRIVGFRTEDGRRFAGAVFIDATYEGDLMAKAGVSYHVGREAAATYGESLNGIRVAHALKHQFTHEVDPFVVPGDAASGLLPLVSASAPGVDGAGDRRVQAYNFRMCTTDVPENRRSWPRPEDYDERQFELLLRNFEAGDHRVPWNPVWMPNRKTDTNNNFAISTDFIGGSDRYPEAGHAERERIVAEHRRYQQGLMWTLANHPRVPEQVRAEFRRLGPAKDEFTATDNWPHQIYVREARRMVSDYVMTQADCQWERSAEDPVGLAAYNMDSHNCQRYVTPQGFARNEGDIQVGVRPYRISYRSIRPRREECENLLVPVCLAASHIAYGSIRMEPVFMVLGQSAATAAALAIDGGGSVQDVDQERLRERLLADGQVLEWTGGGGRGIDPARLAGVVVDTIAARLEGDWTASTATPGFVGPEYLHDGNAAKGEKSATFTPRLPQPGTYEIRLWATALGNRATNVPVTIRLPGGERRLAVDQRTGPGREGFVVLGSFSCPAGDAVSVTISTAATDGHVIADAVQFIPRP